MGPHLTARCARCRGRASAAASATEATTSATSANEAAPTSSARAAERGGPGVGPRGALRPNEDASSASSGARCASPLRSVARDAVRPSRGAPVPSNGADASTDAVDANIATERGAQWRPASVRPRCFREACSEIDFVRGEWLAEVCPDAGSYKK